MIKRSFLGLAKPKFEVQRIGLPLSEVKEVPMPKQVTLMLKKPPERMAGTDTVALSPGETVRTGQKISLSSDSETYVISSVTGTIARIKPFAGDFGNAFIAITIDVTSPEVFDEAFAKRAQSLDPALAGAFLSALPGNPAFSVFFREETPVTTLGILGIEPDLASMTRRFVLSHQKAALQKGIEAVKAITGVDRVVLLVPQDAGMDFKDMAAEVRTVAAAYPGTLPKLLMKDVFGQTVPAGKTCEDLGCTFFSAESVAALGTALETGRFPVEKVITVTGKDQKPVVVTAKIGTPVKVIFDELGIVTGHLDRVVFGGPMTGSAVYTEDYPVLPDTDAILVQDKTQIPPLSQYPCINCGECVRICPARVPVNMLVRYLEAGRYDEAADLYDLHCCIECGLCSFVCVARIPIFQYIRLGKFELSRMHAAEAHHG